MRVERQINDKTTIVGEGEDAVAIFEQLAQLQEVFGETVAKKGNREGHNITFRVRKNGTNTFYELYCAYDDNGKFFGAKLPFGKEQETGKIYPKRLKTDAKGKPVKDENDKVIYLPDNGWLVYNKETQEEE